MRLVFSRKGFDSSAGRVPSPILPDGTLYSLPIPDPYSQIRFGDIRAKGVPIANLVPDLTRGRINAGNRVHLDPDLRHDALRRPTGWRPLFGQANSAQSHLKNQGVTCGDLFLFFGWFRRVTQDLGRWRYVPDAPDLHVLFGWLQIGGILGGG